MRKTERLAYTAGIVDGEGCTCITFTSGKRLCMSVSVTSTDEWLCQWLKMQYGGSVHLMKTQKPNWKHGHRWWLASKQASEFLRLILPYLNLKRPQAELAISFQQNRRGKDKVISEAQRILMRSYNKKGV